MSLLKWLKPLASSVCRVSPGGGLSEFSSLLWAMWEAGWPLLPEAPSSAPSYVC